VKQAYSGGASYGKLWSPTRDDTEVDIIVPRLLIPPPLFVKLIRDAGKSLMPHEVWALIQEYIDTHTLTDNCKEACSFVQAWCLVAGQAQALDRDSHLAFGLDAVTEQDHDGSLATWLDTRARHNTWATTPPTRISRGNGRIATIPTRESYHRR
jgi:hypothetical protein